MCDFVGQVPTDLLIDVDNVEDLDSWISQECLCMDATTRSRANDCNTQRVISGCLSRSGERRVWQGECTKTDYRFLDGVTTRDCVNHQRSPFWISNDRR